MYEEEKKIYTIEEFWSWWTNGEEKVMEVRIRNYKWIEYVANHCQLPFSPAGVYVKNCEDLVKVIKEARKHVVMWFGINPRKKAFNDKGWKVYGGKDVNIESIDFIFIDIDREEKIGQATEEDIKKIEEYSNLVIEDLKKVGIINYCKLFSGNGIQLIIKLDERILLPTLQYDMSKKMYLPDERMDRYKEVIRKTIGEKLLRKFNTKQYKDRYGCSIDRSGFNMGRVGSLPFSYNLKHNPPRMRCIIGYGKGENKGLADSLFNELDKLHLPVYNQKTKAGKILASEFKYKADNLINCPLVQLLLKEKLPDGMRNSHLIFSLKCLIKDNKIDINCSEVKHIFKMIETIQKDTFPNNTPNEDCHFNPNVVNNYCVLHLRPVLYPVLWDKPIKRSFPPHTFKWDNFINSPKFEGYKYSLSDGTIIEDIYFIRKWVDEHKYTIFDIYGWGQALINKYNLSTAKYIFENYLPIYLVK